MLPERRQMLITLREHSRQRCRDIIVKISRDSILGETNFNRISVGDLVSWKDITENDPDQFGIVLSKYISDLKSRKICMLKVAATKDNNIKNILALIVKIESKKTT